MFVAVTETVDQTTTTGLIGLTRSGKPVEVRVENLHKSFGQNHVLRGVNLEIARGVMVAIVGSSGCGKTVLLKHMIGHLQPDEGRVLVADHELPGAPLIDLASLGPAEMDQLRRN